MIVFSTLRTRRLSVELQELSIGDAIRLCKLPHDMPEAGAGEFLKCTVKESPQRKEHVADPRLWTAQERALVMAHYICSINDTGPNFPIGDTGGNYSDYLMIDRDVDMTPIPLGELAEDRWNLHHLLGAHIEAIERLIRMGILDKSQSGWWFGAMAAQLVRDQDSYIDPAELSDKDIEDQIREKADIFRRFPERDAIALVNMFLNGVDRQTHLFRMTFSEDGPAFRPTEEGEVKGLPPARFPFHSAITEFTKNVFGKPD